MLRNIALTLVLVLAGCSDTSRHIEVLVADRADTPDLAAWRGTSADYKTVMDNAFASGARVVIAPISDTSSTERVLQDVQISAFSWTGANPLQIDADVQRAKQEGTEALQTLAMRTSGAPRTEIIAAINSAAERFAQDAPGMKQRLVIISDGFEQSSLVWMADARISLRAQTPAILHHLKDIGMVPRLEGVHVCMASITAGKNNFADTRQIRDLESFYRAFFKAAGAQLDFFGTTLPTWCAKG